MRQFLYLPTMRVFVWTGIALFFSGFALFGQAGNRDASFLVGAGANQAVRQVHVDALDRIYVTGEFTSFNGASALRTVRLLPNGSTDPTWLGSQLAGVDGPVRGSALQANRRLLLGGLFNFVQGSARKNLARLDSNGVLDASFQVGIGPNNEVTGISESNSRIAITGFFNQYNGTPVPTYAVLLSNGALDPTFTYPTTTPLSRCVAVRPNHQVYVGGSFTAFGGAPAGRLVRLMSNGTLDTSFHTATGFNGPVEVLLEQTDGKLLVGGSFTTYNGQPAVRVARLLSNGDLDPAFNPGTGASSTVRALALDAQGRIVVGGQFTTFNGNAQPFVVRLLANGTPDVTFVVGSGLNGNPHAAVHQSSGKIVLGGVFTQVQGVSSGRIVRLLTNPCVPATAPVLTQIAGGKCPGDSVTLAVVGGALVQSTQWTWYSGGCGSNAVGTGSQWKGLISQPDTLWVRGTGACIGPCSFIPVQPPLDTAAPVPLVSQLPTLTGLCQVALPAPPYAVDSCSGTVVGTTTGPALFTTPGTHYIDWTFTDASGNASQQSQQVVVFGLINTVLVDSAATPAPSLTSSHASPQANYQWLRCDSAYAPVSGATSRSWVPAKTGFYAVRVEEAGCVDTSDCLYYIRTGIGLYEYLPYVGWTFSDGNGLFFQKPTTSASVYLRLFDATGRSFGEWLLGPEEVQHPISLLPSGIYHWSLESTSGAVLQRGRFAIPGR
jgi:uncharacterized delta-60 repeat protein